MREDLQGIGARAAQSIKVDIMKPEKMCCACGEDLTGHDEVYPVAVKKTMCARCFWQSLGFGKEEK